MYISFRNTAQTVSDDSGEESDDTNETETDPEPEPQIAPSVEEIERLHDHQTAALKNPEPDSELPAVSHRIGLLK